MGASEEGQARLPHQAVLKRGLKASCAIIPLMKRDHRDNLEFFLRNVGRLHLLGWVGCPCWAAGEGARFPGGGGGVHTELLPDSKACY